MFDYQKTDVGLLENAILYDSVVLFVDFTAPGESSFHTMQHSLNHYLQQRRLQPSHEKVTWDVYEIELNNLAVHINDYTLGNVGRFNVIHNLYLCL
jgi:hypothetical protein